ncbi:MAG: hypothetical protein ACPL1K_07235 [Candidatus Kryptoniota bacterium]
MKLGQKIRNREIVYFFRRDKKVAFELALLNFILAKRKAGQEKIFSACLRALYWLKKAGVNISEDLNQLRLPELMDKIEELLATAGLV